MHVSPRRGVVIGNSSLDNKGNQLPSYARLFTLLLPVDVPIIYSATLQLIVEVEDVAAVCDEIVFSIRANVPEVGFSSYYQTGNVFDIEYPPPKLKLTGQ